MKNKKSMMRSVYTQQDDSPLQVSISSQSMVDLMKKIYDQEEKLKKKNHKKLCEKLNTFLKET